MKGSLVHCSPNLFTLLSIRMCSNLTAARGLTNLNEGLDVVHLLRVGDHRDTRHSIVKGGDHSGTVQGEFPEKSIARTTNIISHIDLLPD